MKKSIRILLFAVIFAAVSCNYDDNQFVDSVNDSSIYEQELIVDGKVSLNRAIANAEFVYKNTEGLRHKNRKIQSVNVLTIGDLNANSISTRSSSSNCDIDQPLAYVVNYENDGGYAILAADAELPPVISIGDEGYFSTDEFIAFTQGCTTRSGNELDPAQEVQYALINNSLLLPSVNIGDVPLAGVDTTMMLKCLPLVPTKWGQRSPYDYYSPMDDSVNKKSAAGCVPVAGAQTLASLCYHHNWRPKTQLSAEYPIDWYAINRMIYGDKYKFDSNDFSADALAVASLIRAVGSDVNASYTYSATSAYTQSLMSTFNKLGMTWTKYGDENSSNPVTRDEIFEMIVIKNYPVNARSTNSVSGGGHSFVLDGWLRLEYSLLGLSTSDDAPAGVIGNRPDNFQYNFDLVHINLGWNGKCDGYYLPDAFDLTKDKYREYAEENDIDWYSSYVYDLGVKYLIYEL